MNMKKIKQGIKYIDKIPKYGLIITVQNNYIGILPVNRIYKNNIRTYCYDDPGAGPNEKHNVQLKNSPDVFKELGYTTGTKHIPNAYVIADWSKRIKISKTDFETKKVNTIDNGAEISDTDWKEICNHLMTTAPQKQLTHTTGHLSEKRKPRELPNINDEDIAHNNDIDLTP